MPVKSRKNGSQKGTFVGNPSAVHIHIVADNTHVQVGGKRHNFDADDDRSAAAARTWLEASGGAGKPGYDDCHEWLGYANAKRK
jgi:hypothetical protein